MYPLFESVGVINGQIQNGHYHELRFKKSYFEYYGFEPPYTLFVSLILPDLKSSLHYKLRIEYNDIGIQSTIAEYKNQIPTSLRVVHDKALAYGLKYTDRNRLNKLYHQREASDDVLIIKNGHITDASYSNIVFTDGSIIVTPTTPLLQGTCRARLLAEQTIEQIPIKLDDIKQFKSFQLINALNDFDEHRWVTIDNINLS